MRKKKMERGAVDKSECERRKKDRFRERARLRE